MITIVTRNVVCDTCEVRAHGVPGSKHRRCGGGPNTKPLPKHAKAPGPKRGTWFSR